MRDIVVTSIIFGSLPMIFVRPHIGILMWAWISYMVPHRLAWGFAYDFPFAQVVGLTTIAAWLLSREPKLPPRNGIVILLGLLAFWITVTTAFALVPTAAYPELSRALKILLMTLLTIILMGSRERIHALVWVIAASLSFYGFKGGLYILSGGRGLVWGPPGGFFSDNNALALALIMTIPLLRYLHLQTKNKWVGLGILGTMGVCVASIIGSYSRGAFLGLTGMALVMILRSRNRWSILALVVAVLVVLVPLVPERWYDRMQTIETYKEDKSAVGRIHAWTYAWQLALHRPLVGGGFGAVGDSERYTKYVPDVDRHQDYHSIYFEMLGGHGFVGLGIFLALAIVTFRCGARTIAETKDDPDFQWARDLSKMVQVSMIGYAISGTFLKLAFFDLYYDLIALQLLTWQVVQQGKSSSKSYEQEGPVPTSSLLNVPPSRTP